MALPTPAPVSTTTSCPLWTSSRAPAGVSATRDSCGLISLATPIRTAGARYTVASGVRDRGWERSARFRHTAYATRASHADTLAVGGGPGCPDGLAAADMSLRCPVRGAAAGGPR